MYWALSVSITFQKQPKCLIFLFVFQFVVVFVFMNKISHFTGILVIYRSLILALRDSPHPTLQVNIGVDEMFVL